MYLKWLTYLGLLNRNGLVEVSNIRQDTITKKWLFNWNGIVWKIAIDNTPCKAEVTGDKATIVELIK